VKKMSSRFTGRVAVVDLTAERAEATVEAIRSKGGQASYGCDATDQDAVEDTFACVDDELDGLHILVNNAGVTATACSSSWAIGAALLTHLRQQPSACSSQPPPRRGAVPACGAP
jgi:NAD(P)-dependent dehydrogenase (short-subunit alcohol dehydrogenase family)